MEPSKTSQIRWERHHNTIYTISTSCAILPTMLCVCYSCLHSRVVEGSWEGIAGCVVHAVVGMESVYVVGGCKLLLKGCSWLAVTVVHGYKVSFISAECFIRRKLTFRLLFCSLQRSKHSMHKTCCMCIL